MLTELFPYLAIGGFALYVYLTSNSLKLTNQPSNSNKRSFFDLMGNLNLGETDHLLQRESNLWTNAFVLKDTTPHALEQQSHMQIIPQ